LARTTNVAIQGKNIDSKVLATTNCLIVKSIVASRSHGHVFSQKTHGNSGKSLFGKHEQS